MLWSTGAGGEPQAKDGVTVAQHVIGNCGSGFKLYFMTDDKKCTRKTIVSKDALGL